MDKKMKISNFLVQLQHIDFVNILMLLSPSILYFTAKKPIQSNYRLRKDFKIGGVKTVDLPFEVIRKFDNINEEEILKKQFGELIMNFVKIASENIPQINLAIFLNNLNTLGTSFKDFTTSNRIFNSNIEGSYDPINNTIQLSEDNYNLTINHELFHASTTICDEDTGIIYCGFHQILSNNKSIGEGLNEGYTQYLSERYFEKDNSLIVAYVYEKIIAEALETIVGKEKMQLFYFNANLSGLVEYLKRYAPEEEIFKFINTLDFLNKHMDDRYLIPSSKKIIKNEFEFINSFLLKTYLRKSIIDSTSTTLSTEDVTKGLTPILKLIPSSVKIKNYSFQVFNDKKLQNDYISVMSEYKLSNDKKTITK